MSSISGYSTQFSSSADYHGYLNIPGDSTREILFYSPNNQDPVTWKEWKDYVLFNKAPLDRDNAEININGEMKGKNRGENDEGKDDIKSCYDIVSNHKNLKGMKWLLDKTGYGKVKDVENKITLFCPIDEKFKDVLSYQFNLDERVQNVAFLQTLRYHILNYPLYLSDLQGRKLRLTTDLEKQKLDTDFTMGRNLIINPIESRVNYTHYGEIYYPYGDPIGNFEDAWFPKKHWEVKVLDCIECEGGVVYIISRPLVYPIDGYM